MRLALLVVALMQVDRSGEPPSCEALGLTCRHTAAVPVDTAADYVQSLEKQIEDGRKQDAMTRAAAQQANAVTEANLRSIPGCEPTLVQQFQESVNAEESFVQSCARGYAHLRAVFQDDIDKGVSNSMLLAIRESLADEPERCGVFKEGLVAQKKLLKLAQKRCAKHSAK
jgi:hypothetical protein